MVRPVTKETTMRSTLTIALALAMTLSANLALAQTSNKGGDGGNNENPIAATAPNYPKHDDKKQACGVRPITDAHGNTQYEVIYCPESQ